VQLRSRFEKPLMTSAEPDWYSLGAGSITTTDGTPEPIRMAETRSPSRAAENHFLALRFTQYMLRHSVASANLSRFSQHLYIARCRALLLRGHDPLRHQLIVFRAFDGNARPLPDQQVLQFFDLRCRALSHSLRSPESGGRKTCTFAFPAGLIVVVRGVHLNGLHIGCPIVQLINRADRRIFLARRVLGPIASGAIISIGRGAIIAPISTLNVSSAGPARSRIAIRPACCPKSCSPEQNISRDHPPPLTETSAYRRPIHPSIAIRSGSTSGSDCRKSSARIEFHNCNPMGPKDHNCSRGPPKSCGVLHGVVVSHHVVRECPHNLAETGWRRASAPN